LTTLEEAPVATVAARGAPHDRRRVRRVTADSTTLPADAASVPTARRFVRTTLERLGLTAAWEAAEMLVSEVVTNAVLHAKTVFTVEVVRDGDLVRVGVTDLSPAVPRQRTYGTDSTTGRGLRLVATLAVAWGVERTGRGKTVWFEVPAAGDAGTVVPSWEDGEDLDALLAGFDDPDDGVGVVTPPRALMGRPFAQQRTPGAAA
jgi:anti-sigma regulatory factor (Ser/Thr protein kinase)